MSMHGDAIRGESERSFSLLYSMHWDAVRQHVEARWDDIELSADDLEELVEDVFLTAWQKWDALRGVGLPWLLRTADNKARDQRRHRRAMLLALEGVFQRHAPEAQALDELDRIALHAALSGLSERERRAMTLAYWDRCTSEEIASELSLSPSAVWAMLSRARGKLRRLLGGQVADEVFVKRSPRAGVVKPVLQTQFSVS